MIFVKKSKFHDEGGPDTVVSPSYTHQIFLMQYPATLWHYFAFRGHITLPTDPLAKEKDKNGKYSTIKGFAKTTMKTVTKATGLKTKQKKSHKYMLPNMQPMHGRLSVAEMMNTGDKFREEDELSDVVERSVVVKIKEGRI